MTAMALKVRKCSVQKNFIIMCNCGSHTFSGIVACEVSSYSCKNEKEEIPLAWNWFQVFKIECYWSGYHWNCCIRIECSSWVCHHYTLTKLKLKIIKILNYLRTLSTTGCAMLTFNLESPPKAKLLASSSLANTFKKDKKKFPIFK